jgi:transcriptional regulator with XRE-family HTH domain
MPRSRPRVRGPESPPIPLSEVIGENLLGARTRTGMTQSIVSEGLEALGIHLEQRGLSKGERGQRSFSVEELLGLALVLGVSIRDLLSTPGPVQVGEGVSLPGQVVADLVAGRLALQHQAGAWAVQPVTAEPGGVEAFHRFATWLEQRTPGPSRQEKVGA